MKRKLTLMLLGLVMTVSANAQFENGKKYIGSSISGLNMRYNGSEKSHFGLQAKGGYIFMDDWMVTAEMAYDKKKDVSAELSLGVGARYYIVQNGLFLGASADYVHRGSDYDDFMPSVQIGYAFFISHTVTIEPEIYYNHSFKSHSDYSSVGFRLGFGVYL